MACPCAAGEGPQGEKVLSEQGGGRRPEPYLPKAQSDRVVVCGVGRGLDQATRQCRQIFNQTSEGGVSCPQRRKCSYLENGCSDRLAMLAESQPRTGTGGSYSGHDGKL